VEKVVIVGNSELAEVMHEYLVQDPRYTPVAFAVDRPFIKGRELRGLPVCDLAELDKHFASADHTVLPAVGYSDLLRTREVLFQRLQKKGHRILRYVHPDARVYSKALGHGAWILPGAFIDVMARVGDNSVVWGNSSVAHRATIQDNCWLATGCVVSAGATIGQNTFVGVNATVLNGVVVGKYNIIGANTIVTKSTPDYTVIVAGPQGRAPLRSDEFIKVFQL
jgi:sugar O-acyltransferase (sialic acid O-acetyltransferase NeuD family)